MRILVSAQGPDAASAVDPQFGRARYFVVLDSATGEWSSYANPGARSREARGVKAASFVLSTGADVVLTASAGANAWRALEAGGIPVFLVAQGTVGQAIDRWRKGRLRRLAPSSSTD